MTRRRRKVKAPTINSRSPAFAADVLGLSNQYNTPRRGTRELLKLYGEAPWLRTIVAKIAKAVADIDWHLYARKTGETYTPVNNIVRRKGANFLRTVKHYIDINQLQEISEHPLLDFMQRGTGDPRLTGHGVYQVTQAHLELVGESYWLLERDGLGVPYASWPLPPHWVQQLPTEKHPYFVLSVPGGMQAQIPFTEIIPFVDPSPENPYGRGLGLSQTLDDEIQVDEWAAKHVKSFFLNRARPDIIISGQFVSRSDAERLERKWLEDHQGFYKQFKPLFFSNKIDVKELSHTFESMQMVQIRKHERDTFINIFNVPPEKLGVVNDSKKSTIAAADYFWNKDIIQPRVEFMRRVLQQTLVPMFDERLILHYETPVIEDEEFKLELMKVAPWAILLNEWRDKIGLKNVGPLGDVFVVPLNLQFVPLSGESGEALTPGEASNEMLKAIAARGSASEPFDARGVADIVSKAVVTALQGVLGQKNRNEA